MASYLKLFEGHFQIPNVVRMSYPKSVFCSQLVIKLYYKSIKSFFRVNSFGPLDSYCHSFHILFISMWASTMKSSNLQVMDRSKISSVKKARM